MANRITIKEIYERLVQLEAKFDASRDQDYKTRKKFTIFVYVILFFEFVNLIVHYYF